jgi:glycosyltransferase involved in cell wall biosynthesis
LLADHHYTERFRRPHPVVPNTTRVPLRPPVAATPDRSGRQRVVYLGSITLERGAVEMVEIGRRLRDETQDRAALHVIGPAHGPAQEVLHRANRDGVLVWHGFVPSDQALVMLDGALAGLSLLHDEANFRPSMPTKVIEYLAHGVPAVTTPLPVPAELVERSGAGFVVPFGDVEQTLRVLLRLYHDPDLARDLGRAGHAAAREEFDWDVVAPRFVDALEEAAAQGRPSPR